MLLFNYFYCLQPFFHLGYYLFCLFIFDNKLMSFTCEEEQAQIKRKNANRICLIEVEYDFTPATLVFQA